MYLSSISPEFGLVFLVAVCFFGGSRMCVCAYLHWTVQLETQFARLQFYSLCTAAAWHRAKSLGDEIKHTVNLHFWWKLHGNSTGIPATWLESKLCEPRCHPFVPQGDSGIMDTMSALCFHALGHSLQRIAMLSSCPQSHLFTHLLCSELKYFTLKPERKTVFFFFLFSSCRKVTQNHCLF